jgi:hypothetical protein
VVVLASVTTLVVIWTCGTVTVVVVPGPEYVTVVQGTVGAGGAGVVVAAVVSGEVSLEAGGAVVV